MPRPPRPVLLAATALATVGAAAAVPATAGAATGATLAVHGRLLVVASEQPGTAPAYGVALADGRIVRVSGRIGTDARTGDVFDGRVSVPAELTTSLHAGSGPVAALRAADRTHSVLGVVGTPEVTAAPAASATTHQQFVAALDNKGALGQTDDQLLGHVATVGDYWTAEANGAIAGVTVPSTVTHYDTALTTTDCGLGSDFFDLVQEAEKKLPAFDKFSGPDQLVLFVPSACSSGGVVGEGTVGSSFASGGALIVKAQDAIEGTYAHETGHNYGFDHANLDAGGTWMEYYGVYDVMGFALGGFNQLTALSTPFRVFQGITDPGEITTVTQGADPVSRTVTLAPRSDDTGVRSVQVVDPDSGRTLYLDYRSGGGQDTGSFYAAPTGYSLTSGSKHFVYAPGVVITTPHGSDGSGTDDLVVGSSGTTQRTSLAAGDAWSNASGSLTVTVTGLTATAATVRVDYTGTSTAVTPAPTPSIAGTARVGTPLTVSTGTWMSGVTLGYQWYVGSSAVGGATEASFTPRPEDVGQPVRVEVTGGRPGFTSVTRSSSPTADVVPGSLVAAKPTIGGTAKVGRTLKAKPGAWSPGTTFSYTWYADGTRIKHRTAARLTLAKAQKGSRITVTVTGTKPGWTTVSKTSARTAKVR